MADGIRFQMMSKQIDEHEQTTEVITTQIEKLTQSQAQIDELIQSHQRIEAMMAALMSQRSNQLSRPPDPPYSASGDLTSYSQAPQPPDPPDIRKSRQGLTIKAPDLPDFNQFELISTNQVPNKLTVRFSCEEIHERMTNGLCIFCEDLDTPGHYNLKHKRSKLCLVECVDDGLPDAELVEPGVENISDKSVNMIREEESNSENESRPEVSVSQFQVPLSSMEPSRSMCNELVCEEDGDSINTMSAKFSETYEDPRFELVCLKQSHDPVENHLDNFGFALTRSSLQHTPTDQYRAPFNPYQNCNDECHYKREFGNYTEHETEFGKASEEVEDDELQDKQPEDDNSVVENQKKLARKIEIPLFENLHEPSRLFDDESQEALGGHTIAPMKPYQSHSQSWYELDTIQSDINFKMLVAHECDMVGAVVIYEVATTFEKLAKTWKFKFKSNPERSKLLDDMFSFMEKSSEKYGMVWESQQGNGLSLLNCLVDHDVVKRKHWLVNYLLSFKNPESNRQRGTVYDAENMRLLDTKGGINKVVVIGEISHFHVTGFSITGQKLLLVKEIYKMWYKEDSWLFMQIMLKGLCASGFEMEAWTVKKSLEWLNKLTIAISLAQMFLDHVCKLQSTPQDMLSDRDTTFLIELFRVLRADLSSDTTYEFIFVQPHPVPFPFRLGETLFAVVMDINFQKKEELIPMSKVHLSQGQNKAATKALVQWKEHPPDQATWEFYQDLVAKYPEFQP